MSEVHESRLDEMASKIASLEEEVVRLKIRSKNARRQIRKAANLKSEKKEKKDKKAKTAS